MDFQDNFGGIVGTLLDAHSPDTDISGDGWTNRQGGFALNGIGAAIPNGADPGGIGWVQTFDVGFNHGDLAADFTTVAAGTTCGLVFRFLDLSNCWIVRAVADAISPAVRLILRRSGLETIIAEYAPAVFATIELGVELVNQSIKVLVDGTERIARSSVELANETDHGIITDAATTIVDSVLFDNGATRWAQMTQSQTYVRPIVEWGTVGG